MPCMARSEKEWTSEGWEWYVSISASAVEINNENMEVDHEAVAETEAKADKAIEEDNVVDEDVKGGRVSTKPEPHIVLR